MVCARPLVREVPSSIPGDIISLFQLLYILCSFDIKTEHRLKEGVK